MSSFFDFINTLRPDWKREEMEDDLNLLITEITNITIPMCEKFDHAVGKTLHSKEAHYFEKIYADTVGTKTKMIEHISEVMLNALECLNKLLELNRKIFTETTITSAAMSFKKASIIRYIESARFVSDYARMLLHYLSVTETNVVEETIKVAGVFNHADITYLETRFLSFAETCKSINVGEGDFSKKVDRIPNAPVNDNNETVMRSTRGDNEVDPMNLCFLPIYLNPFYHLSMGIANYQANRYKDAVNELKVLELRLANLSKLRESTHDTQLEEEIKVAERQISDARYEVTRLNKKYGIAAESGTAGFPYFLRDKVMPIFDHRVYHIQDVLNG